MIRVIAKFSKVTTLLAKHHYHNDVKLQKTRKISFTNGSQSINKNILSDVRNPNHMFSLWEMSSTQKKNPLLPLPNGKQGPSFKFCHHDTSLIQDPY